MGMTEGVAVYSCSERMSETDLYEYFGYSRIDWNMKQRSDFGGGSENKGGVTN